LLVAACVVSSSPIFVTLMKEAPGSFETSVLTRATRRNNPEDTILHGHRRENLKKRNWLEIRRLYGSCFPYRIEEEYVTLVLFRWSLTKRRQRAIVVHSRKRRVALAMGSSRYVERGTAGPLSECAPNYVECYEARGRFLVSPLACGSSTI
jgi:hypothetical protein